MTFDGQDLRGLSPSGDEPAARQRGSATSRRSRCPTSTRPSPSAPSSPSRCGATSASRKARGHARRRSRLLARVGIPDPERTFDAYPHQISGGMAQRVLIAGAVSCDPDLLIADEPTTALDVTVQAEVLDLLRDLQAERHMGVLLVTHNFGVVADLCDRVAVMQAGRIVETGPAGPALRRARSTRTPRSLLDVDPRGQRAPGRCRRPRIRSRPLPVRGPRRSHRDDRAAARRRPDLVVEYPARASGGQPFRALKGVSIDIRRRRDASGWSASPARARRPSAGPCSASPRSPAARSASTARTSPASPSASAGR